MIELYPHQIKSCDEILLLLKKYKLCCLNADCRTGKTFTVIKASHYLLMSEENSIKSVLILTKLNAIESIEKDIDQFYKDTEYSELKKCYTVINYEQSHKLQRYYDLIIYDECQVLGFIGKPKLVNKRLALVSSKYKILMSGTLFTETFCTAYSLFRPLFNEYKNFYAWAKDWVRIKKKRIGHIEINDYTEIKDKDRLMAKIKPYIVSVTQEDAEFVSNVEDVIHNVENPDLDKLCRVIKRKKIFKLSDGIDIVADNISKEFQIMRQLQSGTIKLSDTEYRILSTFKTDYIINHFKDKKIAIYFDYVAERKLLEREFSIRGYKITSDASEFNSSDNKTVFLGQFVSRREGVNLSSCNDLIFFCIAYSNLTYLQSRQRCLLKDKTDLVRCHFILTKFELMVYKLVKEEKGKFNTEAYKKLNTF